MVTDDRWTGTWKIMNRLAVLSVIIHLLVTKNTCFTAHVCEIRKGQFLVNTCEILSWLINDLQLSPVLTQKPYSELTAHNLTQAAEPQQINEVPWT